MSTSAEYYVHSSAELQRMLHLHNPESFQSTIFKNRVDNAVRFGPDPSARVYKTNCEQFWCNFLLQPCRSRGVCVCPCEEQINRRGVRCLVTAHFVCTVIKHILVPLCLPPTLLQHSDTRELSRCFCSSYHPVLSIMSVHVCFQHDRHDMSQ